ncbi:Polyketide synthase enoylreductase [Penicillium robsamsonii]|uniref:Polyketide synthase enoylreductase n=1 Tax=Penicillium robsamsonii TaxID=1792511 RepID=UPI002546C378|nr:Polyketide synthase enoylreductase [Penicillium robsamsonii]KAJ5823042.1 Polyketide synthase enoylreductase [Penicillium robsamsonii]
MLSKKISEFTDGIRLNGAVPRGVCVILGLPESGLYFDAFYLVFREIIVKGSLHCPVNEVKAMIKSVSDNRVISHLTILPLEKAEGIPDKAAADLFTGRLVVTL